MSTSQPKARRGKAFSKEEDEALCLAWLDTTQDPANGMNHTNDTFWKKIEDKFKENILLLKPRSLCSIQNRWANIRQSCSKFRKCLAQIEHRNQSGITQVDKVMNAKILYINDEGKPFTMDYCWAILKNCDKWLILEIQSSPTGQSHAASHYLDSPISLDSDQEHNLVTGSVNSPRSKSKRPIGRNAEKASRRKSQSNEEDMLEVGSLMNEFNRQSTETEQRKKDFEHEKLMIMREAREREQRAEHRLGLAEQRMQRAEQREQMDRDDAVVKIDITGMDEQLQAYWTMRKRQVMQRAMNDASAGANYEVPSS